MFWFCRKIKTVLILYWLSMCVFSYLTDTQDWHKSASYFWNRSYKLLLLLCCWVASSAALQWLETIHISLFFFSFANSEGPLHALNYSVPIWKVLMQSQGMEIERGTCLLLSAEGEWCALTFGHQTSALPLGLWLVFLHASSVSA